VQALFQLMPLVLHVLICLCCFTPLACLQAAATGCAAEEEEAAYRKYALFPFNAHAAPRFLSSLTNKMDQLRNKHII